MYIILKKEVDKIIKIFSLLRLSMHAFLLSTYVTFDFVSNGTMVNVLEVARR